MGKKGRMTKKGKHITYEEHGGFFDIDGLCNICERSCGNHQAMIKHQKEKHKNYKVFCNHKKCCHRFENFDAMNAHKIRKQSGKKF